VRVLNFFETDEDFKGVSKILDLLCFLSLFYILLLIELTLSSDDFRVMKLNSFGSLYSSKKEG